MVWLTDKRRLALFTAETIVRDPHHRESPTHHTSIYENSKLKAFKNIKFFGEISSNRPNDLLGTNVYSTLESS